MNCLTAAIWVLPRSTLLVHRSVHTCAAVLMLSAALPHIPTSGTPAAPELVCIVFSGIGAVVTPTKVELGCWLTAPRQTEEWPADKGPGDHGDSSDWAGCASLQHRCLFRSSNDRPTRIWVATTGSSPKWFRCMQRDQSVVRRRCLAWPPSCQIVTLRLWMLARVVREFADGWT